MRSLTMFGTVAAVVLAASHGEAATITGSVTGPDGAPVRAAFVQARNAKTKITVSVLSNNQGRYRVENLAAGDYRLEVKASGFKADPKNGVTLAVDQNATYDFPLQQGMVRWNELSFYQGLRLLPDAKGQDLFFRYCF